jgi:hypothetical protein
MAITIPADLTIVTLRSTGGEVAQRWTEEYATSVLKTASDLLRSRTNIEFPRATVEPVVEEMPSGAASETVDEAGYHFLAAAHKAGNGVRVLLVDRVSRADLGGQSRQQTRVCLVAYGSDVASTSRMMAHELGHLLSLPHVDGDRRPGPGQERLVAAWMRNLMYSGALNPAAELTQTQVQAARSSPLARRFGGR